MYNTLAFIHTSPVLVPVFTALAKEWLAGLQIFHMVDESLIKNTIAAQALTKTTIRRVIATIESARDGGADAVMVTCSSIGPAVATARTLLDLPILRVDEAMAECAIGIGRRIGVAATLQTTLEPTVALLHDTAGRTGRQIEVTARVAKGAFEAVLSGDTARHDAMVSAMLRELSSEVDVIVLAQASMARVVPQLGQTSIPILSSPELAIKQARDVLLTSRAQLAD